jgi:hypothetical protein
LTNCGVADRDRDGQALDALCKLEQRVAMFFNNFMALAALPVEEMVLLR